ncbi:response regulator transcription factor [Microbacterium galbinum]|nr:helix-turn-helix transcriptional regulator [Microbacterium galbinum]
MSSYVSADAGDALADALRSGDEDAVAAVLTLHVWPLLNAHYDAFERAFRALPVTVRARHFPLEALGQLAMVTGSQRAREVLLFDHRRVAAKEAGGIHFVQLLAARLAGDYSAANRSASRLADWSRAAEAEGLVADGPAAFFMAQSGFTELLNGRTATAVRRFGQARRMAATATLHDSERDALGKSALAHIVRGSIASARQALALAQELPVRAPTVFQRFSASTERAARALIAVEQQDDAASALAPLTLLESADELWPFKLLALARDALARESPLEALEFVTVAQSTQLIPARSLASDAVTALRVDAFLAMDQPLAASRVSDNDETGILTRLARMRVAIRSGDRERARRLSTVIVSDPDATPHVQLESRLLLAWVDVLDEASLSPATAAMATAYAAQRGARLFTGVPGYVLEALRALVRDPDAIPLPESSGLTTSQSLLRHPLTQRERRVLVAASTSATLAEMAVDLKVSRNTVKTQLSSLYRKLGVGSRADAVAAATRLGLLGTTPLPDPDSV